MSKTTVSFSDTLKRYSNPNKSVIQTILDECSEKDRIDLENALNDKNISGAALGRAMTEHFGKQVSSNTISKYRLKNL